MFGKTRKKVEVIEENGERNMRYEQAKQEYMDRYMNQAKTIHTWKTVAFVMFSFFVMSFLASLYLTTRSSIIPYIIEVDEFGATKNIGTMQQIKYSPKESEIKYFLREFISNARNVPKDSVLYGRNYKKNLFYLSPTIVNKYNQVIKDENYQEMLMTKKTVSIKIISIQKVSGTENSYQIRWDENFFDGEGNAYDLRRISAIISIGITKPSTLEEIEINPLGLKIEDFTITKEN